MKELRCKKCDKLLAKVKEDSVNTEIEIKCNRCKTTNQF